MTVTASRRARHGQTSQAHLPATPAFPAPEVPIGPSTEPGDASSGPVHCGTTMSRMNPTMYSAAQGPGAPNLEEWSCTCGFRTDTGGAVTALQAVTLAAGRLERLQWELDTAEEELCAALRAASSSSVTASSLARAAGLTLPELTEYLQRPAMEPAWDDLASLRFS